MQFKFKAVAGLFSIQKIKPSKRAPYPSRNVPSSPHWELLNTICANKAVWLKTPRPPRMSVDSPSQKVFKNRRDILSCGHGLSRALAKKMMVLSYGPFKNITVTIIKVWSLEGVVFSCWSQSFCTLNNFPFLNNVISYLVYLADSSPKI